MMAHTPGPWHRNIKPAWKYPVVFAGRNTHIATLARSSNREDAEGNINLIAAAPELLEALEELTELCEERGLWPVNVSSAKLKIAKARGA